MSRRRRQRRRKKRRKRRRRRRRKRGWSKRDGEVERRLSRRNLI